MEKLSLKVISCSGGYRELSGPFGPGTPYRFSCKRKVVLTILFNYSKSSSAYCTEMFFLTPRPNSACEIPDTPKNA